MNVTCPQCSTVFRVDPAKVPEQGVRARCSVCSGLIAVRRPPVAVPAVAPFSVAPSVEAPIVRSTPHPPPVAPPPAPAPARVTPEPPPRPPEQPVRPPAATVAPVLPALHPEPQAPAAEPLGAPPPVTPAPARFNNPFLQQDPSTRARRLARALVSDLVVYYPEKRRRGLAEGNLKELFGEEIRKSWEEYTEQVGEEIASNTPYFTEALNEILAEGRSLFG